MLKYLASVFALFPMASFADEVCPSGLVSGAEMESRDSQGARPTESFFYSSPRFGIVSLDVALNSSKGVFLWVPTLGEYVRNFDWSYCEETNEIHFLNFPLYTRSYRYVSPGYELVVHAVPTQP